MENAGMENAGLAEAGTTEQANDKKWREGVKALKVLLRSLFIVTVVLPCLLLAALVWVKYGFGNMLILALILLIMKVF